ncbi:hypothetical protein DFJ73DRAFT_827917 [Zopfochytrium polystomum]|nr:hypothetical protein DFJ73DRAFT_827917 [Zopfochytrium polystomum]
MASSSRAPRRDPEEAAPLLGNTDDELTASSAPRAAPARRSSGVFGGRVDPWGVVAGVAVVATIVVGSFLFYDRGVPPHSPAAITAEAFTEGLAACERNAKAIADNPSAFLTGGPPLPVKGTQFRRNPRYIPLANAPVAKGGANGKPIHIKNATVWDGIGNRLSSTDLVLAYGVISKIGKDLSTSDVLGAVQAAHSSTLSAAVASGDADAQRAIRTFSAEDIEVIDVEGRVVSPGIVDQHSHVTTDSFPSLRGNADTNEIRPAANPQLRVVDSMNVMDPAFDLIVSGGVTTSLILPGSALLMGGEAFGAKMLRTGTNEAEDLSLNLGMAKSGADGKIWRWMKMACGENPKRVAAMLGDFPTSRMGNGWAFRARFEKARELARKQDDWCEAATSAQKRFRTNAHLALESRYPDDLINESLAALLRGDIRLNVHCYEPHDQEMMIRNKHEFGFQIATFHHATEAHLVGPMLARENISVAIFADHSLYKKEAYSHSVRAGQILHDAGVKFSYKSDHPVLNAQNLLYEAQKGAHYGVDPELAFMAVTSVPAERLGLGWRIGRIAEGFDADVVVWDRPPLELGAHPLRVIIDGYTAVSRPFIPQPSLSSEDSEDAESSSTLTTPPVLPTLEEPLVAATAYTVTNISAIYAGPNAVRKGSIVVNNGIITCLGQCTPAGTEFNLNGGSVIPGLVVVNTPIGLFDIDAETTTADGIVDTAGALANQSHAADGVRVGGKQKHLEYAVRSGVLTAISPPVHRGFAGGFSTAFRTGAELYSEAIIKRDAAFHVTIGESAREPSAEAVTAQIARLRRLLTNATQASPLSSVVDGTHPLVVNVNEPNDISKVLGLVKEGGEQLSRVRLVIAGGAGAWKVADQLAGLSPRMTVLLQPARCVPSSWETRECRPAFSRPTATELLTARGVPVAVSVREADQVRSLRFEAGWLAAEAVTTGVSVDKAIGAVTWTAADALLGQEAAAAAGVGRVQAGTRAAFVGLNAGSPRSVLSLAATVQLVADGSSVTTQPRQD